MSIFFSPCFQVKRKQINYQLISSISSLQQLNASLIEPGSAGKGACSPEGGNRFGKNRFLPVTIQEHADRLFPCRA